MVWRIESWGWGRQGWREWRLTENNGWSAWVANCKGSPGVSTHPRKGEPGKIWSNVEENLRVSYQRDSWIPKEEYLIYFCRCSGRWAPVDTIYGLFMLSVWFYVCAGWYVGQRKPNFYISFWVHTVPQVERFQCHQVTNRRRRNWLQATHVSVFWHRSRKTIIVFPDSPKIWIRSKLKKISYVLYFT